MLQRSSAPADGAVSTEYNHDLAFPLYRTSTILNRTHDAFELNSLIQVIECDHKSYSILGWGLLDLSIVSPGKSPKMFKEKLGELDGGRAGKC